MTLTVKDVARLLGVTERTVYRWIKQEQIPACQFGEQYRFHRSELLEWATARRLPFSPELMREQDTAAALPSLVESLRKGGIHYRVEGRDKLTVLRAMTQVMPLPEVVDREFLLQMLLAREAIGTTALGHGIAIPHVRNPIVLHVDVPAVVLGFLERPVDFEALDGEPVATLFLLVTPTVRAHLHVLSRLAHVLHDAGVRAVLSKQGSREEIFGAFERAETAIGQRPPASEPAPA
jgi:PTS system nitrogen regulatory IIA component